MIMRIITIVLLAGFSFTAAPSTELPGISGKKTFKLNNDIGQNNLKFLSDAPMEKINGTADGISGWFTLDAGNLEATTGKMTVQVRSMKTAISKRDEHMYSEGWLNADKFSTVEFEIEKFSNVVVNSSGGRTVISAKAIGKFTCHGVTTGHSADIVIVYVKESSETKKRSSGDLAMITAKFNVALKDHNITGMNGLVGSKVGEEIKITASLFANS